VASPRTCIDIDGAATVRSTDVSLQDQGPPVFRSVVLSCAAGTYVNDGDIPASTIQSLFEAAMFNNNPALASSLSGLFANGPNEAAVSAFDASSLGSFMTVTTYIGAVRDASDTWYRGWTCDSTTADFSSTAPCTQVQYR